MKTTFFVSAILFSFAFCISSCQNTKGLANTISKSSPIISGNDTRDIVFMNSDGKDIRLGALKGKVVFINFWATWCLPCRMEMPGINKLKKSFKENGQIVFMTVDTDGDLTKSSQYMHRKNFDLDVFGLKSNLPEGFMPNMIPATFILNKNGDVVARVAGAMNYAKSDVRKSLERLMDE
ncbi:MAG: TlpA family protein disulfide reductase [Chitinophagaceae bacterium]|nr:TlpA family protein disulfide reductase [Chitinophagaceae bacterium]